MLSFCNKFFFSSQEINKNVNASTWIFLTQLKPLNSCLCVYLCVTYLCSKEKLFKSKITLTFSSLTFFLSGSCWQGKKSTRTFRGISIFIFFSYYCLRLCLYLLILQLYTKPKTNQPTNQIKLNLLVSKEKEETKEKAK
jgi:hypothetical protein